MFPSLYGVVSQGAAAASWWVVAGKTCVAAYQPIGAASLAASYTNLANPGTYDAAPGVAPTWASATGWTFDGSTQYLTTGVVPATNQSWSAIIRYSGQSGDNRQLLGSSAGYEFQIRASSTVVVASQRTSAIFVTVTASNPGYGIAAMAGRNTYFDAVSGGTIAIDAGSTAAAIFIGQRNNYSNIPSGSLYFLGNIQAVAIYSDTLSGAEVAALTSTMAALT